MYSYTFSSPYQENYQGGIPKTRYLLAANFGTTNPTFPIRITEVEEENEAVSNHEAWIKTDYMEFPKFQILDNNLRIWPESIEVYQQPTGYSTTLIQEKKVYVPPGTDEYVIGMIGLDLYKRISQEDREFLKLASNMFNLGDSVNIKRILSSLEKEIR